MALVLVVLRFLIDWLIATRHERTTWSLLHLVIIYLLLILSLKTFHPASLAWYFLPSKISIIHLSYHLIYFDIIYCSIGNDQKRVNILFGFCFFSSLVIWHKDDGM